MSWAGFMLLATALAVGFIAVAIVRFPGILKMDFGVFIVFIASPALLLGLVMSLGAKFSYAAFKRREG